ncbi:MAG: TolC family protein [Chitinophagales bacterium]
MKKIFLSLSLIFFYLFVVAQANKLTLQQCVDTALKNNFNVQQNDLLMQITEINWKQAKLNLLPNLNAAASQSLSQGRSIDPFTNAYINEKYNSAGYGLNSQTTLFQGLAAQNLIKQNSLNYQASKMDWQQAKDNATINVILAYLQVLTNEDLLTQAENQADYSQKQVDRLEILNKQGAISPSDLSNLKGQLANDQLSIINSKNALEISKINLCQLMNIPYDKNIELEKINAESYAAKYEQTSESIYQTALQQFALVKAVDFRMLGAEKEVKVAKGQLFPRLSFNANVNTNYSSAASQSVFVNTTDVPSTDYVIVNGIQTPVIRKQSNFSSEKISYNKQLNNNLYNTFSLDLGIPIFNSLQQRNRVKLARIDVKNAGLVAKTTKTQLQQSIEQAYTNMTSAGDRYRTLLDQVSAYSESFHAAEIRFNNGVGTSIDYQLAKNNLDQANINLISAKYDYVLRTKILDYYQGKQLW